MSAPRSRQRSHRSREEEFEAAGCVVSRGKNQESSVNACCIFTSLAKDPMPKEWSYLLLGWSYLVSPIKIIHPRSAQARSSGSSGLSH